MRLIDADRLIEDFKNELEKVDFEKLSDNDKLVISTSAIALRDFVKRQPTAYDIDKVVDELENQECEYQQFDMPTNDYECGFEDGCEYAFRKAIEIVKAGD